MKKILSFRKGLRNPFTWICTYIFVMATTHMANAQNNPFSAADLTGQKDTNLFSSMNWIFTWGVRLVIIAAMLFGIGNLLFGLYKAFNDARDRGEWGGFVTSLVWSIVIIVASVAIAGVAWVWADNVDKLATNTP